VRVQARACELVSMVGQPNAHETNVVCANWQRAAHPNLGRKTTLVQQMFSDLNRYVVKTSKSLDILLAKLAR
jgi:hypothetical protein